MQEVHSLKSLWSTCRCNNWYKMWKSTTLRIFLIFRTLNLHVYRHFITKWISLKQTKCVAHGKFRECLLDTKSFYDDLKDGYFSSLLLKETRKNDTIYTVRQRNSLDLGPIVFYKLLKAPLAILRELNISIIVYLDNMLLLAKTLQEILMAKNTVIFLLQHLRFVINLKIICDNYDSKNKILGLIIDSVQLTLSLTPQKLGKIRHLCWKMYRVSMVSVL